MKHALLLSIFVLAVSCPAAATTVSFVQDGWSAGGPLSVSFFGVDVNADDGIAVDELLMFAASWITPGGAPTSWGMSELQPDGFLFIDRNTFALFAGNSDYSVVATSFGGDALSSIFDQQLFTIAVSADSFAPVPEPGPFALVAVGIAWLACRRSGRD